MILSNKKLLPLLWELFPGHDNLLPAYSSPEPLAAYARKPIFGREGAGITLSANGREVTTAGDSEVEGGAIYQALLLPPSFDHQFPVVGSWIVGDEPAGIGVREASTPVTTLTSRFVPHRIVR
jgi:glutathionylspermidine synthase